MLLLIWYIRLFSPKQYLNFTLRCFTFYAVHIPIFLFAYNSLSSPKANSFWLQIFCCIFSYLHSACLLLKCLLFSIFLPTHTITHTHTFTHTYKEIALFSPMYTLHTCAFFYKTSLLIFPAMQSDSTCHKFSLHQAYNKYKSTTWMDRYHIKSSN